MQHSWLIIPACSSVPCIRPALLSGNSSYLSCYRGTKGGISFPRVVAGTFSQAIIFETCVKVFLWVCGNPCHAATDVRSHDGSPNTGCLGSKLERGRSPVLELLLKPRRRCVENQRVSNTPETFSQSSYFYHPRVPYDLGAVMLSSAKYFYKGASSLTL